MLGKWNKIHLIFFYLSFFFNYLFHLSHSMRIFSLLTVHVCMRASKPGGRRGQLSSIISKAKQTNKDLVVRVNENESVGSSLMKRYDSSPRGQNEARPKKKKTLYLFLSYLSAFCWGWRSFNLTRSFIFFFSLS